VVLAGARRAELERAVSLDRELSTHRLVVAVDGGVRTCRASGLHPDLFVGDGDSSRGIPADIPSIVYPTDKAFSDLAGALDEVVVRGVQVVTVAGLLGGRLDHEWANLHEIGSRAPKLAGILAPTARGTVCVTSRGCRAATEPGQRVSLMVLGGAATVSLRGTRWTLRRKRIRPGSRGLSNVTGTTLDLAVHSGVVALVFPDAR
jgi:thiamine pyrophosphokinase